MAVFNYAYEVGFSDVDAAGIVYYPRFFHLCHVALEAVFREMGPSNYPDLIQKRHLGLPIVHAEGDFKKPLYFGDSIIISVTNEAVNNSSILMRYEFLPKVLGEKYFLATITTVCVDINRYKSITLPDDLRNFLVSLKA